MSFRDIILENLTNYSSQLVVKLLCSKIDKKWTVMTNDKNRSKASFEICNNDLEGEWSTLVFTFKYGESNQYEIYVDDNGHNRHFSEKFSFSSTNKHAVKYVDSSYREVGNKLYKLFTSSEQITLKQLEQALQQFTATANYINKL